MVVTADARVMTDSAFDATLVDLATSQHGVLTTRQLTAAGISPPAIVKLVAAGELLHPGRGLYLLARTAADDDVGRHRQLVAGAFALYPDAMLTGVSTVLAHGLPVWGVDLRRPTILRPVNRSGGVGCLSVRARRWCQPLATSAWGPSARLADALAQLAVDAGTGPGVVSADAALREGLVGHEDLTGAVDLMEAWPRRSRAVTMVAFADGRRESVGESRCGVALAVAGIVVTPQVEIHDRTGRLLARVDFLVDGTNVVIEFDGKVKYAGGDPSVLWREKRREDELRALGYTLVRITWADLERPGAVAAKVRAAIRQCA